MTRRFWVHDWCGLFISKCTSFAGTVISIIVSCIMMIMGWVVWGWRTTGRIRGSRGGGRWQMGKVSTKGRCRANLRTRRWHIRAEAGRNQPFLRGLHRGVSGEQRPSQMMGPGLSSRSRWLSVTKLKGCLRRRKKRKQMYIYVGSLRWDMVGMLENGLYTSTVL